MTPEGHNDLSPLLQRKLQEADRPLSCHDLFDMEDVKQIAPSANRVSDYLGVMFRRGLVSRIAHEGGDERGRARWRYLWRARSDLLSEVSAKAEPINYRPKAILDRPNLHISEDGTHLHIEMPEISIQIQIRKK